MPDDPAEVTPTPESIASYVKKNAKLLKMGAMMHGPMVSVREVDYNGHHILIRTTYEIEVDGQPLMGHIDLSNEGQIAYHGLPNMSFDSAVDLVEKLIDKFPEDFQPGAAAPHDQMSGMADMGGMKGMTGMAGMAAPKAKKPAGKPAAAARPKSKTAASKSKPKK